MAQYALATGLLASVACGVVGTYVVVRRISYIVGGIAHCVLGGIGAAVYLRHPETIGWTWLDPLYGAIAAALAAAVLIGWVSLRGKGRADTLIGALWAIGMAAGVLFFHFTPGYPPDLKGYLFGNILMASPSDLVGIAILDAAILGVALLFYNHFLAICFDEEFARARGINVEFYYILLLVLTALTVVLLVTVVGIVLVIALVTLPVAAAGRLARSIWQMMVLAVALTALLVVGGMAAAWELDLPVGPPIIVLAGGVYLAVAAGSAAVGLLRRDGGT